MAKKVLGIDLGTTYSCVAYMDENDKPVVLKNAEGDLTTPSVVFFETKEEVTVGASAKENSKLYPDQVVSFIKRSIGQPGFSLNINGVDYKPEVISSYILKKVVSDAIAQLREECKLEDGEVVDEVVITCPAYFGINERTATEAAGKIAGLKVLSVINEPTAAAITYGVADDSANKTVLVYDLGGGTFDVTMINIKPGEIKVVCTGGDHNLGGKDWDDRVIMYLADEFQNQTGITESIMDDAEAFNELSLSAERAKKLLTSKEKAPVSINFMGERARIELTREKFDEITTDLVERTISLTEDMFAEAEKKGFKKSDVAEILLVGGSSRMPQIARRVKEIFGIETKMFDPDQAVAKGAAIYAKKKSNYNIVLEEIAKEQGKSVEEVKSDIDTGKTTLEQEAKKSNITFAIGGAVNEDVKIVNVSSRSFGIIALENGKQRLYNIIRKNDELPKEATQTFSTLQDNQKTALLEVKESLTSEEVIDPELGKDIGEAVLELPPNTRKGTSIEVTFRLDDAGLLHVRGRESVENRVVDAEFQTKEALTQEEMTNAIEMMSNSNVQ